MGSRSDFLDGARRLVAAARPAVENVLVHQRIDSTHACTLRLIEQAENEEIVLPTTLIIAVEQDRGHGRAGRAWTSPPGGLYLSWISATLDPSAITQLPMIAAAAAHEALNRVGVADLGIKWPNDLMVSGRKLAGLLVHARHGSTPWVSVGVGINLDRTPALAPDDPVRVTAVADLVSEGDFFSWAETIISCLTDELQKAITDPETLISRWREHLLHLQGDEMVVRIGDGSHIRGRFAGLTDDGHLRLEAAGKEQVISTGDVIE